MKGKYMADFFGGQGSVAAGCRAQGLQARGFDTQHGDEFDLTRASVRRPVIRDIADGKIVAAALGPPCGSWGPAGNRTAVLRTQAEPWGISTRPLTEKESARIEVGNNTMEATLKLVKALHRHRVPWIFEHPQASKVYSTKEWQEVMALPSVHTRTADQCQYGTKWRKRTTFTCGHMDELDTERLSWRCTGKRGWCSRTGKRHSHLEGTAPGGKRWTAISQAYPPKLGRAMSMALLAPLHAKAYNKVF